MISYQYKHPHALYGQHHYDFDLISTFRKAEFSYVAYNDETYHLYFLVPQGVNKIVIFTLTEQNKFEQWWIVDETVSSMELVKKLSDVQLTFCAQIMREWR